jgi:hypothetical protein
MWQAGGNQRRGADGNRKRGRAKMPFHIKRVRASLKLEIPGGQARMIEAWVLLNDFSPDGMGLFTANKFNADDQITVTLESPKKIEIKARIAWSMEVVGASRILKAQACPYRAGVEFLFTTPEEREAVKAFCDELLNTHHCVSLRAA